MTPSASWSCASSTSILLCWLDDVISASIILASLICFKRTSKRSASSLALHRSSLNRRAFFSAAITRPAASFAVLSIMSAYAFFSAAISSVSAMATSPLQSRVRLQAVCVFACAFV
uniref:Uncharacterized protein n=1 Tax=Rhizophora mucronata TaxID=61149 RepID=A0A2P2QL54_RHIMU